MKVFTEKEAEKFLKKEGFDIIETEFVKREFWLKRALRKFKFPIVLKISGKKIIHKTKVKGVKKNIKNYSQALKAFKELKKIKGFDGVLIQKQIIGKEFLLGLKKTPEFGYVLAFGKGGSRVEEMKQVNFRVCDVEGIKELSSNKEIQKIFWKLCGLADKKIDSLDINPLILEKGKAVIVDSQIIFE